MVNYSSTITTAGPVAQRRPSLGRWLQRMLGGLLIVLVVLALAGGVYQTLATARDVRAFSPPGQLVDIGGYKLHLYCQGEGSPTVILESGQANSVPVWAWVQPAVAKTTRVCAYDRAGVGWSDASPQPRDAQHSATELHTLLKHAAISAPYILVGHSFGGLVTHVYAVQYPDEVAGLVWLDVEHPGQWTRTAEGRTQYQEVLTLSRIGPWLARIGLVRLSNYFPLDQDLPLQAAAAFKVWLDTTRFMTANAAEFQAQLRSAAQAQAAGPLGALPLFVLTATDHGYPPQSAVAMEAQWQTMQNELAALSTNSVHQIVDGATHGSLQAKQGDAEVSSAAIARLVDAIRRGAPLSAP